MKNYCIATHKTTGPDNTKAVYIVKSGLSITQARDQAEELNRELRSIDPLDTRVFFAYNPQAI